MSEQSSFSQAKSEPLIHAMKGSPAGPEVVDLTRPTAASRFAARARASEDGVPEHRKTVSEKYKLETMKRQEKTLIGFLEKMGFQMNRIKRVHEALSTPGIEELRREELGGNIDAVNQGTSRVVVRMKPQIGLGGVPDKPAEEVTVYEKTQNGQISVNQAGKHVWKQAETDAWQERHANLDDGQKAILQALADPEVGEFLRQAIAEEYGIEPSQVEVPVGRAGYLFGTESAEVLLRERFAWICDMIAWGNVVPVTVLRSNYKPQQEQLVSWQRGARGEDPAAPPREFEDEELFNLWQIAPDRWANELNPEIASRLESDAAREAWAQEVKRGLVMSALLDDVFLDAVDGRELNMLISPVSGRLFKLDNSLSVPLLPANKTIPIKKEGLPEELRGLELKQRRRSWTMELVAHHQLKVDEPTRAHLKGMLDQMMDPRSELRRLFVTELQLLCKHPKIVQKKLEQITTRLAEWVQHGTNVSKKPGVDFVNAFEEVVTSV
jgi:hypothetical protein